MITLASVTPCLELSQVGARLGQLVGLFAVQVLFAAEWATYLHLQTEQAACAGLVVRLDGGVENGQAIAGVDRVRHLRAKQFY